MCLSKKNDLNLTAARNVPPDPASVCGSSRNRIERRNLFQWLQRDGLTHRQHLLDVSNEEAQATGLKRHVALRFARMLESVRGDAPLNGVVQVAESTDVLEIVAAMVGIEAVLKAIEAHGSSADVQAHGCKELGCLARDEEDRVLTAQQGIEAVVKAMKMHRSSVDVQQRGCYALGNLAANNADNKVRDERIAKKKGIEAVLKAMKAHGSSVEVQDLGCDALGRRGMLPAGCGLRRGGASSRCWRRWGVADRSCACRCWGAVLF